MDFDYISSNVPGAGANVADFEEDLAGCDCEDGCTAANGCKCLRYGEDNYDATGSLLLPLGSSQPVLECHSQCVCSRTTPPCRNRVVQEGVKFSLEPILTDGAGYGVRAKQRIPANQFVIEYIGEVISREEAAERSAKRSPDAHNYIFTVEEIFEGKTKTTFIDGTQTGNLARFINHSCEPNLRREVVRIGRVTPCLALFAVRDIEIDEELSYDYGELSPEAAASKTGKPCRCGAKSCRGFLPSGSFFV